MADIAITAQLKSRADERLKRVRAELARHLAAKKTAEGFTYRRIQQLIGIDKTTMCHMLHPGEHDYPEPGLMNLAVALEWLGLTWGDLDQRLAIEDYDLTREHRLVMLAMHDKLYLALKEAEGHNSIPAAVEKNNKL